jgi:CRP-like cAMP-binding protein
MLAGSARAAERPVLTHRGSAILKLPADALTPIEKVLALQKVPIFADVAPDQIRHLASIAIELPLKEGSMLFTESDPSAVWVMLAGRAVLESPEGGPLVTAEAGDVVGMYETLAGSRVGRSARVTDPVRVLRVEREELFDLFGQRPELLQQMLSALFRAPAGTDGLPSSRVATV